MDKIELKNGSIITIIKGGKSHRGLRAYTQMIRNDEGLTKLVTDVSRSSKVGLEEAINLIAREYRDIIENDEDDNKVRGQRRNTSILEYDKYGTLDSIESY